MRYLLPVMLLISLVVASPLYAQKSDTDACDPEAIQAFYDQIDPDQTISVKMLIAINKDSKTTTKIGAIEDIRSIGADVEALEFPECIQDARDLYLEGVENIAVALEAFVDGDFGTFASTYAQATQRIGEFRGYVMAYGAKVQTSDTISIYMR